MLENIIKKGFKNANLKPYYSQLRDLTEKTSTEERKIFNEYIKDESKKINFHTKKLNEIGTKDSVCPVCLQEITKNDREHIELEKNKIRKEITNCEEDIESLNLQVKNIRQLKADNLDAASNPFFHL